MSYWKIADLAMAAVEFGFNRADVAKGLREMEENGHSPRELGEYVEGLEKKADEEAQAKIDAAKVVVK